jgi:glycosyltransferase involved in cell wall biosynthesis
VTPNDATPSDRATGAVGPAHPEHLSVVQVVRSDAFAGVERYICQVANELVGRGHHVVAIGGDPGRMRTELRSEVAHRPAASVGQVARALSGQRSADVVHVHMTAAEAAAWLARPVQRAPIVATRHFPGDRGRGGLARLLARITSRPLARDIAISQFVADSVQGPCVLLPNGVSDRPQAALDSHTVVMLQRLTPEKSPELGLRAWSASGLGAKGWRLVVAGAGDLDDSMRRLADQLQVSDSVDFVGLVTDTDRLLDESAVLLAPASAEPFGLSVVEAMAHGVPVVAADGGAHVETVGEDGMLFAPGDADAAARALVALSDDLDLRRRVGGRLRDRQQGSFSLPRHVERLEDIYRQVIAEATDRHR